MLVSIAEHIGAPIGATATATTHTAVRIAVTIQRTSGLATTDSGGTTDSLTRRGGHAEGEAYQHSGSLTSLQCPLRVKSRHLRCTKPCPVYPRKQTLGEKDFVIKNRMPPTWPVYLYLVWVMYFIPDPLLMLAG